MNSQFDIPVERLAAQLGLDSREPQTVARELLALVHGLRTQIAGRDAIIAGLKDKVIQAKASLPTERTSRTVRDGVGTAGEPANKARCSMRIRVVCATRADREGFFSSTALGKSLTLFRPPGVEIRLFPHNERGLSAVYNTAIEESSADDLILLFVHDDVHLCDFNWTDRLREGLLAFDMVGLAGNRRRLPGQAGWAFVDEKGTHDTRDNLSGVVAHGHGYPAENISVWGQPGQRVKLLDGLFLAVRSAALSAKCLRFDERFDFHFYDLDFCRQAEQAGLVMGTWPISVIHESMGNFASDSWHGGYETYIEKWGE